MWISFFVKHAATKCDFAGAAFHSFEARRHLGESACSIHTNYSYHLSELEFVPAICTMRENAYINGMASLHMRGNVLVRLLQFRVLWHEKSSMKCSTETPIFGIVWKSVWRIHAITGCAIIW